MTSPTPIDAWMSDHLAAHIAALGSNCVGMGYAPFPQKHQGAWLVPPDMWDGAPDSRGMVKWKSLPNHSIVIQSFPHLLPLEYRSYIKNHRVGLVPFFDGDRIWALPPVQTQDPEFHHSLLANRWAFLCLGGSAFPLCESLDGEWLACADPCAGTAPSDSPILELRAEDMFRLEPRLAFAEAGELKAEVRARGRVIFHSFREMLTNTRADRQPLPDNYVNPFRRTIQPIPPQFDWGPLLLPAVADDSLAVDQSAIADHRLENLEDHLDRIVHKLTTLRGLDPAYLTWGAEHHQYRMNPCLLPEERAQFEVTEKCHLPDAYARYLMRAGNGGWGPWQWLHRVECSGAAWLTRWWLGNGGVDEMRLVRPFPHRRYWCPKAPSRGSKRRESYDKHNHIDGTIIIAHVADRQYVYSSVLLVVTGAERGHIWLDMRNSGLGIRPACRRGPFSFLAWIEDNIDNKLNDINLIYSNLLNKIYSY